MVRSLSLRSRVPAELRLREVRARAFAGAALCGERMVLAPLATVSAAWVWRDWVRVRVPAATVVGPVKLLAAVRRREPGPALVRGPAPEMTPGTVRVELAAW